MKRNRKICKNKKRGKKEKRKLKQNLKKEKIKT